MAKQNLKNVAVNAKEAEVIQEAGAEVVAETKEEAVEEKKSLFQRAKESKVVKGIGVAALTILAAAGGYVVGKNSSGDDGYSESSEDFAPTFGGDDPSDGE